MHVREQRNHPHLVAASRRAYSSTLSVDDDRSDFSAPAQTTEVSCADSI